MWSTSSAHSSFLPRQTEALYQEIEALFYSKPEKVDPVLKRAGVHDLSALLKRWLRELPQPLLANDLVHLFYQTNGEFHLLALVRRLADLISSLPTPSSPGPGPGARHLDALSAVAARKPKHNARAAQFLQARR